AGALLRRVRNGWDDVRAEVERELEVEQIRRAAREAAAHAEAAQQEVRDGLRGVHEPLAEVDSEVDAMDQPMTRRVIETTVPIEPAQESPQAELPLGEPVSREPASPTRHAAHDDA